jgi:hypothetical protein
MHVPYRCEGFFMFILWVFLYKNILIRTLAQQRMFAADNQFHFPTSCLTCTTPHTEVGVGSYRYRLDLDDRDSWEEVVSGEETRRYNGLNFISLLTVCRKSINQRLIANPLRKDATEYDSCTGNHFVGQKAKPNNKELGFISFIWIFRSDSINVRTEPNRLMWGFFKYCPSVWVGSGRESEAIK